MSQSWVSAGLEQEWLNCGVINHLWGSLAPLCVMHSITDTLGTPHGSLSNTWQFYFHFLSFLSSFYYHFIIILAFLFWFLSFYHYFIIILSSFYYHFLSFFIILLHAPEISSLGNVSISFGLNCFLFCKQWLFSLSNKV